jgi:predicted Zn-dependent protease
VSGRAARAGTAAVTVAVLAWLGVMERDVRLRARGVAAAGQLRRPADVARAEADLRGARFLNPDTAPDVDRAVLYLGVGRPRQAAALLEDVVRQEPQNRIAWAVLYGATRGRDPAAAGRALAALRRLDPINARGRG